MRLVQLRGGLTVFLAAIELMLDLERRGYRITRQGGDLVVAPRAGLTAADLDALRAHKADCLLLADYTEAR